MLLEENEIQSALEQAKIAFPNFDNWQYNNEVDKKMGHYDGFCLWGEFAIFDNGGGIPALPRRFFVTFQAYQETWTACLTIGQHCYRWSSADMGDALLLHTGSCKTLHDASVALKSELANLFRTFSAI